jgi:predicted nuclease of restriction endonuclease-like (RecB) superfamily
MAVRKPTFNNLVSSIRHIHESLLSYATKAVNISLTLRNWLIGFYIHAYEQHGSDRARYGEYLLESIAARLKKEKVPRTSERELRRYRQFYLIYPHIRESVTPEFKNMLPAGTAHAEKGESPTPKLAPPAKQLLERLSFTHFAMLLQIDDAYKRVFYENECMRGGWSVRELKRQIASLYFERSQLSRDKKKLAGRANTNALEMQARLAVRDPYIFEFLGLKASEVIGESDLEDAMLDKLQEFLLEMGHGFCFESRQKRILIGDEFFFIDLLFYHRILKCHILVELKVDEFTHEHLGQLNTYVSWYKRNEMAAGDNPPIGILLCTGKNRTLVEYALADMDNHLFISKYQLELPRKEEIRKFLKEQVRCGTLNP